MVSTWDFVLSQLLLLRTEWREWYVHSKRRRNQQMVSTNTLSPLMLQYDRLFGRTHWLRTASRWRQDSYTLDSIWGEKESCRVPCHRVLTILLWTSSCCFSVFGIFTPFFYLLVVLIPDRHYGRVHSHCGCWYVQTAMEGASGKLGQCGFCYGECRRFKKENHGDCSRSGARHHLLCSNGVHGCYRTRRRPWARTRAWHRAGGVHPQTRVVLYHIVMKACVLKYSKRWTSRFLKIEAEKAWPIMWHLLLVPLTDRSTSHCSLRSQSQSTVLEQENILVSDGQSDYSTHISKSTCSHSTAKMKYYKMMCFEGEHELQRRGCCIDLLHRLSHSFAWIIKAKERQKKRCSRISN